MPTVSAPSGDQQPTTTRPRRRTCGKWRWDGSGATAEMVVQVPDTAFALTLPDGRVLTLGGAEEGRLRLLARTAAGYAVTAEVTTQGGEPCHGAVLPGGRHVVVVNYHLEGSVLVLALDPEPRVVQRLRARGPGRRGRGRPAGGRAPPLRARRRR